jgi:uncharacterized protein YciI
MVDPSWQLEDFIQNRNADVNLYVVLMRPTDKEQSPTTPDGAEMLRQHFLYLWQLEERGNLFGAGPMDPGTADQIGFCVIAAATREDAEALAHSEPFHKAGWRVNEVHNWHLNEGAAVPVAQGLTDTESRDSGQGRRSGRRPPSAARP